MNTGNGFNKSGRGCLARPQRSTRRLILSNWLSVSFVCSASSAIRFLIRLWVLELPPWQLQSGRNSVNFEIDREYLTFAAKRLESELSTLFSDPLLVVERD